MPSNALKSLVIAGILGCGLTMPAMAKPVAVKSVTKVVVVKKAPAVKRAKVTKVAVAPRGVVVQKAVVVKKQTPIRKAVRRTIRSALND
ncbi:hypothetical protein [Hirschia maritima]|uniref:hypothetical protein n=1 Tax=Hirschia maritima TaxID=1121961 RepID=UPI0003775B12|nr:hypothetical protein [Hirschia maritima]